MHKPIGAFCIFVAVSGVTAANAQEEDDGQIAFNNHCRTCHALEPGDNRLGPTLHEVMGREAGSIEGYEFSEAMSASDVVWDAETMDAFIENPDAVVSGHGMRPYPGIDDAEVRAAIVSFLEG